MNVLREAQADVRIVGEVRNEGAMSVCLERKHLSLRSGSLQDRDLTPFSKSSGKATCVQRASETELILLLS